MTAIGVAPSRPLRATVVAIVAYVVLGVALLPVASQPGPESPGFNALFAGGMVVTELTNSFLLFVMFRQQRNLSVLLLMAAFLFSAVMGVGYLLAYPGAMAPGGPLIGVPQSIAWIYNSWIVGFGLLTLAAVACEAFAKGRPLAAVPPDRSAVAVGGAAVLTALLIIGAAATTGARLPLLAGGGVWTSLNAVLNSSAVIILATAVLLILLALRPPRDLFLWLSVALATIAIGNALSVAGGARYSIGWYACRLSWLASGCVLLLYFLAQFARQLGQLSRAVGDLEERTRERDRIWSVSEDLLGVSTFQGYFISLNPAWEKVLGWTEPEVRAMHVDVLRHSDDARHSREGRARLAAGESTVRMQNRFRHKDGTWRWISWTMTVDQGLIYVAGRDITVEKQAEEALRKAEVAAAHRQKMEALGQLTGGVAHDFNNLLMIVSGYIPRLKAAAGSDPKVQQAVLAVETAGRRGAALTRQLLSFSRRQPVLAEVLDIGTSIVALAPVLRSTLGARVTLQIMRAPDLWLVKVDASEFELALLNIVLNARDAIDHDGAVTITAENRHLMQDEAPDGLSGAFVVISVRDTGHGISTENLPKVFDPFFTTKSVGKGTGLGLSQVHGFSRQSGGTAAVESAPGRGTTVTLFLPRSAQVLPRSSDSPDAPEAGSGKVLLVEDNAEVAAVSRAMLEESGYTVTLAADARSGLTLFDGEDFDLVVSDIAMPGEMDGIALAGMLRLRKPGVPIVLVTGYTASAQAVPEHFTVLRKPFQREQLAQVIARSSGRPTGHRERQGPIDA